MNDYISKIRRALTTLIDSRIATINITAIVNVVDKDNNTCDITTPKGQQLTVRLRALLDGSENGVIVYPALNSQVIISLIENNRDTAYVSQYGEVEEMVINFPGGIKAVLNADGVVFNGGTNNGMVKINDLVTRLNNLESAFNSHTHILTLTSGTGTAAPTILPVTETVISDLEDPKVKH